MKFSPEGLGLKVSGFGVEENFEAHSPCNPRFGA